MLISEGMMGSRIINKGDRGVAVEEKLAVKRRKGVAPIFGIVFSGQDISILCLPFLNRQIPLNSPFRFPSSLPADGLWDECPKGRYESTLVSTCFRCSLIMGKSDIFGILPV